MSFFTARIYDRFMANLEEACLTEWRSELLQPLSGEVLEIGAGTGVNIHLYPNTLRRLVLSEPDKAMRGQLERKLLPEQHAFIEVTGDAAEQLSMKTESFDYVVIMLVGCSVGDPIEAFMEVKRVLKPGGKLVFMEHVAAEIGTSRRRWQNLVTPFWRKIAGNCHLNRNTEQALIDAGFSFIEIKRESMRKAASIVRPTIRGYASVIDV